METQEQLLNAILCDYKWKSQNSVLKSKRNVGKAVYSGVFNSVLVALKSAAFCTAFLPYDKVKTAVLVAQSVHYLRHFACRIMSASHWFPQPVNMKCSHPITDELSQTRPIHRSVASINFKHITAFFQKEWPLLFGKVNLDNLVRNYSIPIIAFHSIT